jgi:hypothetical protein
MSHTKACVQLGAIQAQVEVLESLPYRTLTEDQLDLYLTTAQALLRSANYLVESLSAVEVV